MNIVGLKQKFEFEAVFLPKQIEIIHKEKILICVHSFDQSGKLVDPFILVGTFQLNLT